MNHHLWCKHGANVAEMAKHLEMNPPDKVKRARQSALVKHILEIQGLRYRHDADPQWTIHQHYSIPVFHLQALTVFRHQSGQLFVNPKVLVSSVPEEIGLIQNQRIRYLTRQAVRAVYALGLDFGIVRLGLNEQGRAVISEVDPCPALTSRLGELFAKAIQRYTDEVLGPKGRQSELLLGMDPECILVNKHGKVVSADLFFEKKGSVGCDSLVLSGRKVIYPLLEFRPRPQPSPEALLRQLRLHMQRAETRLRDERLQWLAGGMPRRGFALGGHLHFSGKPLDVRWLRALDHYLALPLIMLEDDSTSLRRPRYGFLGDHRVKRHGGFEYRTLPSWIVDPGITKGMLYTALVVAHHYHELPVDLLNDPKVLNIYYSGDKDGAAPLVRRLWEHLEATRSYGLFRHVLEPFKQRMMRQRTWNEQRDIRKLWGLEQTKPGVRITNFERG